jgi:endonuclease/exonuclease/phosphatase family metal-dependent hydrolase
MLRLPIAAIALSFAAATIASAEEAVRLKVMTFNIWYGGDQVNFAKVIEAIRAADADIVGLQEPDGKTLEIAAAAGYPYADTRRHILSRFPLFDSGSGETTFEGAPWYSVAGVDPDRVHAWAMVAPGKVVAVANTHLTSDPYGPELLRDGSSPEDVLANEADTRTPEAQALVDGLKPVIDTGVPVILTGDFNTPSHLDWTDAAVAARGLPVAVEWPTTRLLADAGFTDSYRAANPDPVTHPGLTWTPGRPAPVIPEGETHDRIDHVQIANATAIEATVVGEPGNPDVGIAISPWPSDHRAVLATIEAVPVPAPALITTEPRPVRSGDDVLVRVHVPDGGNWSAYIVPRGGDVAQALTGIADVSLADRPTILLSTAGIAPGPHDAVLLDAQGQELARHAFSLAATDGRATLTLAQDKVTPGADIALAFTGAPGFKLDWIGIYRAGDPSVYNYLGFAYTGARHDGAITFPAADLYEELAPGDYEARLMFDDHYRTLAIAPFTVTAE